MASAGLEPVIIEDLVKFGEDRGLERGLEQGLERGLEQGLEQGLVRGLRLVVIDLCEAFGIDVGDARRARLEVMSVAELEALRATIKQTKRWPGAMP